jgi:tRNA pseudouridine55 synthase
LSIDGILNILKPPGKTSFQLVSLVRRLTGERRVGHAGTLDPYATGVLPICLGQATRVIEFMADTPKTYRAEIQLGAVTDTYDATGKILKTYDPSSATYGQVSSVLDTFQGTIKQIPPMYSAIKHQGKPLYKLARLGIEVPRKPREVQIHRAELVEWQPPIFAVEVECSSGTYIRSLAHDIGQKLGCGAFIKELARLRCGRFDISQAISITSLEEAFHSGYWADLLHPIDEVLLDWTAVIVDEPDELSIRNGRPVVFEESSRPKDSQERWGEWCRAYSADGHLLAVLRWQIDGGSWHPAKVFCNTACPRPHCQEPATSVTRPEQHRGS